MLGYSHKNLLESEDDVNIEKFMEVYGSRISQESEQIFVKDFMYPLLGEYIKYVIPQYPFLDSEGSTRRIDFVFIKDDAKLAFEIDGETYHSEGLIPKEDFDDNLRRQNEIINAGWFLQRFSFNQLLDSHQRKFVSESLKFCLSKFFPDLSSAGIKPNYLQERVLEALDLYRKKGWKRGVVVLPTGTGKTILSALDSKRFSGRVLFVVHNLSILKQSKDAFEKVIPDAKMGFLTGEVKENVNDSDILFASKDTLYKPEYLHSFSQDEFDYIIIDEVHHGQSQTYRPILKYFKPQFMLGMTATPDRNDRKDIFELFDYNKIFEYTLNDAIKDGFLVPYNYYGLKDNIDYSKIRYNGRKYSVQDLDKYLIIKERNEEIFNQYIEKANNKAIGFCCSIRHADAMAAFFNEKGIPAVSITSNTENREEKIQLFRENKANIAFTVDLFNEGIDFPDVRTLLFLRPTESKTIFLQQLGRGLRLNKGKENITVLDFIGNYKKANNLRKYLGTRKPVKDSHGSIKKFIYEYSPGCKVVFDEEVEEILDKQDIESLDVTKEDLISDYYAVREKLSKKPNRDDINEFGEYNLSQYVSLFGSWTKFLKDIGEYSEASFTYPQGTHLGHILYILKVLGEGSRKNTHLDDKYIKLRGNFDEGIDTFQRQTKYKLLAMMELGIIEDIRDLKSDEDYIMELTPNGQKAYDLLRDLLEKIDLTFNTDETMSWRMKLNDKLFNVELWKYIKEDSEKLNFFRKLFLETISVSQMINYIYKVERSKNVPKINIYEGFFKSVDVSLFCEREGIEIPSLEGSRRRCPFLLNLLESIGIITISRSDIAVNSFLICDSTMDLDLNNNEPIDIINRKNNLINFIRKNIKLNDFDTSLFKESFGASFLTENYFLDKFEILE